ncbi:cellulase family glycosylhydrolase [Sphingomonas sp. I4]
MVLRGVNEMFSISTDPTGMRTMPEIARTGANAVRIFTLPDYPAERLDAILAHAVANGLIPIVECHAATGKWDRLGVCVDYWTRPDIVAVLRRNRRWTLVNIANEAGETVSRDRFIAGYLDAIMRIRAAGVDTPLIIDGTDWGKEYAMLLDSWPVSQRADPRHAIMVSAHSYWVGTEEERKAPYRAIIAKVTRDNIPFFLGEGPTGTGWDCKPSPYRWAMTALQNAQIGWLAWSWGWYPMAIVTRPTATTSRPGAFWAVEVALWPAVDGPAPCQRASIVATALFNCQGRVKLYRGLVAHLRHNLIRSWAPTG